MTPLEVALTVFVWVAVVVLALLGLGMLVYIDALANRAKAQTVNERRMHST